MSQEITPVPKGTVTVTFLCEDCGEFDIIKTRSNVNQTCSCGKPAEILRVVSIGLLVDGVWKTATLQTI